MARPFPMGRKLLLMLDQAKTIANYDHSTME
jgi:hypothetical protein